MIRMSLLDNVIEVIELTEDQRTEKLREKEEKESIRKEIPIREILLTVNQTAEELNIDSLELLNMMQRKYKK